MSNVRTVSETKRAFYSHYARPVTSVYRRVVEELMVEMHLLSVNVDFVYDPLYALGIVTTFDRFMAGYRPESEPEAIFAALCKAVEQTPEQYRNDADHVLKAAEKLTLEDLKAILTDPDAATDEGLAAVLKQIRQRDRFKYNRPFGVGLYTVIEKVDSAFAQDNEQLMELLKSVASSLSFSFEKLQKDLELYRSNLEKLNQAKAVMADVLAADRKKREERAQALAEKGEQSSEAETSDAGDASSDKVPASTSETSGDEADQTEPNS